MTFNFLKVISAITQAMAIAEKIKGAKGGQAKLDAVIETTPDMIAALELGIDKDILNDAKVISAEKHMISAIVSFQNAVRDVKAAKTVPLN